MKRIAGAHGSLVPLARVVLLDRPQVIGRSESQLRLAVTGVVGATGVVDSAAGAHHCPQPEQQTGWNPGARLDLRLHFRVHSGIYHQNTHDNGSDLSYKGNREPTEVTLPGDNPGTQLNKHGDREARRSSMSL